MVAAAILTGGKGRRLGGAQKPLIEVGGRHILDRQLDVLAGRANPIFLVGGDETTFADVIRLRPEQSLRWIADLRSDGGPLAGLEAALAACPSDRLLLLGGDMPDLQPSAIELLLASAPDAPVIAAYAGRVEPLFAVYARRLLPMVREQLDAGCRDLQSFLRAVSPTLLDEKTLRAVDPELRSLTNVNTPDDLARTRARLAGV